MARKGLGKGLDSLIPDFYNEDFDSNSTQSLEDLLNENENDDVEVVDDGDNEKNIFEEIEEENNQDDASTTSPEQENDDVKEERPEDDESEDVSDDESIPSQELELQEKHIAEVKKIVDKNPRITLWSSRSSAVFRYLRKTEPEFSISKEASSLIEEAVSKKYPEIWALFEDY